jgi:peptide/nickel transport system ATP-binding protein
MNPVLELRELTVDFGSVHAVRGVSVSLHRGQRLGLVGESGSGKSVTALSVMRLVRGGTTSGQILLDREDVLKMGRRKLETVRGGRVAMVYQDPMSSLNPVHTIGRQLCETLILHTDATRRTARSRAIDLLDEVGVPRPQERLAAYPHEFSGGMRQRVMIAMALCGEPEVLIADEPTTALDVTTQARIIDLLDRIVDEHGTAVMLITHNLGVAAGFCDDVMVMRHGAIVERAPAQTLYAHPTHPYTRGLLAAVVDLTIDITKPIPTVGDATVGDAGTVSPVPPVPPAPAAPLATLARRPGPVGGDAERPATALLRVDAAVKTFALGRGRMTAVDNVSFAIRRGQTFGLVGESGSGKSTVSRCVLGLDPLDCGRVEFDGVELSTLRAGQLRALRRRMQMVFQDPFSALNRRHTVERLVTAPLLAHHVGDRAERAERVDRILNLVGIGSQFRKRLPREMSGGQCQRVAIARALVLEPDFVVLDESVSALDVSIQAQVLNLLRDLQAQLGLTYLFVSHDLGVIRYMCSEIAVMRSGAIVEQGTREQLFAHPQHEYTRALLAAVPTADPVLEKARRREFQKEVART